MTAERAEALLNQPFDEDYYLLSIVAWGACSARAFYRRRVQHAGAGGSRGNQANRDGKDEAAKAIIRDNPDLTIMALVIRLKDTGIKRGKSWVSAARIEARGTGVKVSQG
jgi:hypothetical protein